MPEATIHPTVGRVVWFYPASGCAEAGFARHDIGGPYAALIAHVWTDSLVNLTVLDANGTPHGRTSVPLLQAGQEAPDYAFCDWMPFQKGQAAKTEQLEARAAAPRITSPVTEQELAAAAVAPRVSESELDAEIAAEYSFTVDKAVGEGVPLMPGLELLTICVLVLKNGFTVTGESACASAANFDPEIGRRLARKHAVGKVWPLLGFRLRDKLAGHA